ncbi:MAG: T9SS type A sorting domain-containing protein [Bacteroidota bacterium]|nr:T9SS type A sorting domain-containing protein [Bacteroidota bacterium]
MPGNLNIRHFFYAGFYFSTSPSSIFNHLLGETIFNKSYKKFTGELSDSIDLGEHAKGIYFVEIIAENKREIKKFVPN